VSIGQHQFFFEKTNVILSSSGLTMTKETDSLLPNSRNVTATGGERNSGTHPVEGFSFIVAVALAVNFAMGAGFLSLPWAFHKAGILLSIGVMALVAVVLFVAILFNLEAMARAEVIDHLHKTRTPGNTLTGNWIVGSERYEVSDLCSIFMGKWTKFAFLFLLSIYSYGTLWSFCAVFSKAMSSTFPLGDYSYEIYLIVYALIVIPLTCMDVTEQIKVQVFLAFCRLVVVILMVGSVFYGLSTHTKRFNAIENNFDTSHLIHWSSLHIILPVSTFAFIFTHNIPVISEPVNDKRQLHWIYLSTALLCFVGYTSIGIFVSLYFGTDILSSCNLNWADPTDTTSPLSHLPLGLAQLISLYIVIFPALDVVSAFPLNAITLGNNLLVLFLNHTEHVDHTEIPAYYKYLYRLCASVPSFFLAYCLSDVGTITDFTGIAGFFLGFLFPPLVAEFSERYFLQRGWNPKTAYSFQYLTSSVMRKIMFLLGLVIIGYTLWSTIRTVQKEEV
jgi:amino acid permease